MAKSVTVSASISIELGEMLSRVSKAEKRPKSYYIRKGLEQVLRSRLKILEEDHV